MSDLFEDQPAIKPVWQVIPQFFRYPFGSRVLPTLIVISLAAALTVIPILGFFIWLFLWAMLFKVSYEILTTTAQGEMEGPQGMTGMSDGIMFKHIGLLIGLGLMYILLVGFVGAPAFALALGIFMMLAIPAAIMTLAMTQSLLQALNPVMWVEIMRRTGAAYLLTSVFLFLMLVSQTQAEGLLLPLVGGSMLLFSIVSMFISAYFMAASFHLMGYLLYQHHDDLGIEVVDKTPLARPEDQESTLLDETRELAAEGRVDEATERLRQEIESRGAEPQVHDYYRRLLKQRGDQQALVDHGRAWVPVLLHAVEDPDKALDVAEECARIDRAFEPSNPADVRTLAQRAFDQYRHDLVLRLTNGFGKRHPGHAHVVDNYLLAARSLVDGKGQVDKARTLLAQLRKRFPDHALAGEVAELEASLPAKAPG